MDRRRFLHCLSSVVAATSFAAPVSASLKSNHESCAQSSLQNAWIPLNEHPRIGFIGVVGVGVYFLDRVVRELH